MDAAPPAEADRCRWLLTHLLDPVCGDERDRLTEALLDEFGTLAGVLGATPYDISRIVEDDHHARDHLGLLSLSFTHILQTKALSGPVLSTSAALLDYLHVGMAHARTERFRVLFLDAQNRLIRDEELGVGSVSGVSIHPRPIVLRAMQLGAAAIILVHNHPSGDPEPSQADIRATRQIADAANALDIRLYDHLVIATGGYVSFRARCLL